MRPSLPTVHPLVSFLDMSFKSISFIVSAVAASVVLSGCTSEDEADHVAVTTNSHAASDTSEVLPTSSPAAPEPETDYDRYARALTERGIIFKAGTRYTSTFSVDQGICDDLRSGEQTAYELATLERVAIEGDNNGERIKAMVPILCPDQQYAVDEALSGTPLQTKIFSSKYLVAAIREPGGPMTVQPGTWTTTGPVSGCYWERGDANGNIIDNNFVSYAPSITVQIAETDGTFVAQRCGDWTRAD